MDELIEHIILALDARDIEAHRGDGEWAIIIKTGEATYGVNIEGVECL